MRSKSLHRFVWVVAAGGAASAGWTAAHLTWPDWTADGLAVTALLAAGLVIGEWLPTRIWRGDTFRQYTFSGTFTVGLIITGPFWLAAGAARPVRCWRTRSGAAAPRSSWPSTSASTCWR
jgi:hypothetical protein